MKYNITFASDLTIKGAGIKEMEGARRRFLGNGNYQQGTAIIIKMFWWRNVNLCEWNVNERKLVRKADGVGEQQLSARDSN